MFTRIKLLLTFFLINLCYESAYAQVVIPPENAGAIDTLFGQLTYPKNHERALELMLQSHRDNQAVLMEYYGLQALNWAKEKQDSNRIVATLSQLANNIGRKGEYTRSDSFLNLALDFASSNEQRGQLYLDKIGPALRVSDYTKMNEYLALAREEIGDDTLSPLMSKYHFNKGLYHFEVEQDFVATLIAFQLAKNGTLQDSGFINIVTANLSNLYLQLELYDKAKKNIQEEFDFAVRSKNVYSELFALYGLGYISLELKEYEELKGICDQIFELNNKHGISTAFSYSYFLLGEYYLAENQLDSAKNVFQAGVEHSIEKQEEKELIDCLGGLMRTCVREGNYLKAIEHGEQAISLQYRPDHDIEEQLAFAYQQSGRHKEAYETLKAHTEASNSEEMKRTSVSLTSKLLEDRFAQDKKEAKRLYEKDLSQQRLQLILTILGFIILGALLTLFLQAQSRRKLKDVNNSLIESNQALRQFAYITSHDLKEPIRNITSFSNLLNRRLKQKENTEEEKDFLGFITRNAIVLKEIVDSLQIFTSISFGDIKREIVQLEPIFETVKSNLSHIVEEKKGVLVINEMELNNEIYFSSPMLILLLQNLIQNGFKYNDSEQPIVKVSAKAQDGKTLFQIEDNGIGIDSEYFERIFTPFKTLKNKTLTQSSGLGLSICKNILERYDGRIWVDSDGHSGSTFSFLV